MCYDAREDQANEDDHLGGVSELFSHVVVRLR